MDKNKIRKEIAALIDNIKEHSDNIGDTRNIPQLELEAILNKITKLYEKSIIYNHLNSTNERVAEYGEGDQKAGEIKITKAVEPVKKEEKSEIKKHSESITPPADLFGEELPPIVEKPKQEKKTERKEEKKEEKATVSKIKKPAIDDLAKAIGLNDRFLFANELFSGNMQEFSIAIQQLNTAGTIESAIDYFENLQQLYEWDLENASVKQLLDLIDRRYSS